MAASLALGGLAWLRPAAAAPMDPAVERLVKRIDVGGQLVPCALSGTYRGSAAPAPCVPDDAAFAKLIAQYGFAIAPTAMTTARTTGFGGLHFSLETSITKIDKDADYWTDGTRGAQDANTQRFSSRNVDPDSTLTVYLLKVRKGFPFGLELTANVGWMGHTSIVSGGADVRWSLLEGFRTGIPGFLPDLSAGVGVRTITPATQFNLTVLGVDGQISKALPIANSGVLTPSFGYQWVKIFGDSGLVDSTPATDPLGYCGFVGPNVPGSGVSGNGDPNKPGVFDGQPVCQGGSAADFNNTFVFDQVRIERRRFIAGLQYRYEMVFGGVQFITDATAPKAANSGKAAEQLGDMPKQWTLAFDVGAAF